MKKRELLLIFILIIAVAITMICRVSYAADDTITSTTYEIKDSTIYAVPTSNTLSVSELLENLTFSEVIDIYDTSNNEVDPDATVGSGYKVKVSDKTYNIVVYGDVTGEGTINLGDISRLYNYYKKKASLSGDNLKAGKVTKNSSVSLSDIAKLYNFYKGNSAFSYYSKDHPDGITKTVNKTVNNVAALKSYDASIGSVVQTKGYTDTNDGGGGKYIIEANTGQTIDNGQYIKLSNGNIAKLIIAKQTVNVKQFGAKGDGTTDDHTAFNRAFSSSAVTIKIPSGTYNMNSNKVTLKKYQRLVGGSQTKTTIKNCTLRAFYGLSAEEITFDTGVTGGVGYVGVQGDDEASILINVTPNGVRDVYYKNCTFKNATVASYALYGSDIPEGTRMRKNIVKGCTFTNLKRLAIYHTLPMTNGTYIDNKFLNLGGTDMETGLISAIFLGDITNNTRYEVDNIIIKDNKFDNLVTKDNFSDHDDQEHIINANFIAIRGYNALIDHNEISNLVGYGNDREGVYTKIQNLTVSNNTLTDAGLGEGYICAKAHFGDATFNFIHNTITGKAGVGIRTYGPGLVQDNTINIENSPANLDCTISDTIDYGSTPLTIDDNKFFSGTSVGLTVNGRTVEDYASKNKVVGINNVTVPIIFKNNIINPATSYSHYITINNPYKDVTVSGNKFYLADKAGGNAVGVANGENAPGTCLKNTTTFSNNYFESNDSLNVFARVGYTQKAGSTTGRKVYLKDNTFKHTGTGYFYPIKCATGSANNDTLYVSGNTTNTTQSRTLINTDLKNKDIAESNFATISYTYNY